MLGIEVTVKGETLHRAAVENLKTFTTRVSWAQRPTDDNEEIFLAVGSGGVNADGDFVKWPGREDLGVGDEIVIRIVELEDADEPELQKSLSNEITAEISSMIQKIKALNPLDFGS